MNSIMNNNNYQNLYDDNCNCNNNTYELNNNNKIITFNNPISENYNFNNSLNTKILNSIPSRAKSSYNKLYNKTPKRLKRKINYQKKYETLKNNIDKIRADIVKERMNGTNLTKEYNKLLKKEKIYDDIFKENNYILKENEALNFKLNESEEIRKQQSIVLNSLKREFNELNRICSLEGYKSNFNFENQNENENKIFKKSKKKIHKKMKK